MYEVMQQLIGNSITGKNKQQKGAKKCIIQIKFFKQLQGIFVADIQPPTYSLGLSDSSVGVLDVGWA